MKPSIVLALLATAMLAGCADSPADQGAPGPVGPGPTPIFNVTLPASVTGLQSIAQLERADGSPFPSASGIWPHGDHVFGSGLGAGFFIADISDPENPVMLWNATVDADDPDNNTITSFSRDADVVAHPDGRLTLVLATQSDGMHIWDVTTPSVPRFLDRVQVDPNHNVAVVPGTTFVFNSQSGGTGRSNDLVDLSNPEFPAVVGTFGAYGCHDITFFGSYGDAKFRAYCAGIQRTEIWDLDGFDPNATDFGIRVLGAVDFAQDPASSPVIGNPAFAAYPLRTLHHLAMVNKDASILIIGDEQNGGGTPGGCFAYNDQTGASSPTGALFFYDLSDEMAPELLSWISPDTVTPSLDPAVPDPGSVDPGDPNSVLNPLKPYTAGVPNCTAHFGTLVPGEDKIVMAWYRAGVVLIDFTGVSATDPPRILDQYQPDPINTWDARIHGGYVFTGDTARGMDVLKLV